MTAGRIWAWDFDEMKSAGTTMDEQQNQQTNEDIFYTAPTISGFTPINLQQPNGYDGQAAHTKAGTARIAIEKSKTSKQRRINPYAPKAAPNRKAAALKKPKRARSAADLNCKDISKSLQRKKASSSETKTLAAMSIAKTRARLRDETCGPSLPLIAPEVPQDIHGGSLRDKQSLPLRLGATYQMAYTSGENERSALQNMDASINGGIPSSPPTLVPKGTARHEVTTNFDVLEIDIETAIEAESYKDGGAILADSVVPPSAQRYREPNDIEWLYQRKSWGDRTPSKARNHDHFNSDEIFKDQDDQDDFPLDDEGFEDLMQSIAPYATVERDNLVGVWGLSSADDDSFMEEVDISMDVALLPNATSETGNVHVGSRKAASPEEAPACLPSQSAQSSRILTNSAGNVVKAKSNQEYPLEGFESGFDDDDFEEGLFDLPAGGSDILQPSTPLTSPGKPMTPKLLWMPPKIFTPAKSSQVPVSLVDLPHLVPTNADGEALPFMRPPFPKPIRDRSPIPGLSNQTTLRICFRIGEALNAAAVASRAHTDAIIELYARVVSSERENERGFKQSFQFGDLFTDKPPYLSATYNLWKGVGLWDLDSKAFLGGSGKGKLARIMGRIKRRDQGGGCEMTVMSIWEVDWEDVGVAKGIVCF